MKLKWRDIFIAIGLMLILYRPVTNMLPQMTPSPSPSPESSAGSKMPKIFPYISASHITSSPEPVKPRKNWLNTGQQKKIFKQEDLQQLLHEYFKPSEIRYFEPLTGFPTLTLHILHLDKTPEGKSFGTVDLISRKQTHPHLQEEFLSIQTYKSDMPIPEANLKEAISNCVGLYYNSKPPIFKFYVPFIKQQIEFCKYKGESYLKQNGVSQKHIEYNFFQIRPYYLPDRLYGFSISATVGSPKQFEDFLKRLK